MHTAEPHYAPAPNGELVTANPKFKVFELVAGKRGGFVLAALALVLALPALRLGFMTDDRAFAEKFRRGDGPLVVYSLTPAEVAADRARGMFPWWTSPDLRLRFFRPLSALSHELDYRAWPNAPWAMHLGNCLLYALLVLLAFTLYRELVPAEPRMAALAALMFAIDDGHATAVGWISSRSMLLASLLALSCVLLHVKARMRVAAGLRAPLLQLAATGCFALSLCAAESGLAALAYLAAYAVTFERGSWAQRLASLLPAVAVFVIWAVVYISGQYGTHGLSLYRELSAPGTVLGQGLLDVPAWLLILLGPSLIDSVMMQSVVTVRVIAALLCVPLLAALYVVLPRTRQVRFFALGALLCLPPLFPTLPQDRLLLMASFGSFGVLAAFLTAFARQIDPPRWLRGTRFVLIALHLVLAPLLFVPALGQNQLIDRAALTLTSAVPAAPPAQIVLLNSPVELLNLYAWQRLLNDPARKRPSTFAQLYAGSSRLTLRRVDARTLELTPERGWGRVPIERIFAKLAELPRAGADFEVSGMEVKVAQSTPDGRPARVLFRFPTRLEDPQRLWLVWRGSRPVRWQPPAVGARVTLGALSLLNLISGVGDSARPAHES